MIFKLKIIPAALLLITSSLTHAGLMGEKVRNGGFYIGAGVGPDSVDFTQRAHVVIPGEPGFPASEDILTKVHLAATGVFGTLFVGVEKLFNRFYLAAEINGNISSVEHSQFNDEFVHKNFSSQFVKIKNSFGISILPGFQFNPNTLFYGRLGYTNSLVQQKTSDVSLVNFSHRFNGFRYGLGVKQAITDRFSVRIEYSRISYGNTAGFTIDPLSLVTKDTQLIPNQQLVEFGVIYNFDVA